MLTTNDDKIKQ